MNLEFPDQLDKIKEGLRAQENELKEVARIYADAIASGGMVHVYANGHSRQSVEETVIRMGALTGFNPILTDAIITFNDVTGPNGIRVDQFYEKVEGIGKILLKEVQFGPKDVLVVVTATGTTAAAVDMALEFSKQYPGLKIVGIASKVQSAGAAVKHSCGKNLIHIIEENPNGYFIDNSMPYGDLSVKIEGKTDTYHVCPLSTVGAISVAQCLNELTVRELDHRGIKHHVLRNMHIADTTDNYDEWLDDQRKRYALGTYNPNRVIPITE
ncbi:sugar isomerase domain-containing protein [Flavivirga algicola]|uniref:Sugar isomerase domain-containing protein n=1 Tax=Flavivirga algicola TaxID=2729136 RepID=A0ABX1RZZ9_9FLAO|nr:sugar isomerase domain-containing protein [Flavivirga algicola]NMH87967.1 sugar isomerase domain-containing protein [Flavivirga algicola]